MPMGVIADGGDFMIAVTEIEKAVSSLPPDELAEFRAWFEEFDAAAWDKAFEEDVASGRLDAVADDAMRDFQRGKFKEL